jgi:hypothetical protein
MIQKLTMLLLLALTLSSCEKNEQIQRRIYFNTFSSIDALDDFELGQGDISILAKDGTDENDACLHITGWCTSPNLTMDLHATESPRLLKLTGDMKSNYGAIVYLQLQGSANDYVKLETYADLFKARKWNHYSSEVLSVPANTGVTLWIDAANQTVTETSIDNLEIIVLE